MKIELLLIFAIFSALAVANVPAPNEAETLGAILPDVELEDDIGRTFRIRDLHGAPLIISPVFTSCLHTCTPLTRSLLKTVLALQAKKINFRVLTLSFDPDETTESLRQLRQNVGLPSEWLLARGTKEQVHKLLESIDFKTLRLEEGGFAHPNLIAVVRADGSLSSYVYGVDFPIFEVEKALVAASRPVGMSRTTLRFLSLFLAVSYSIFIFLLVRYRRKTKKQSLRL
jgi:protein SCO1/2